MPPQAYLLTLLHLHHQIIYQIVSCLASLSVTLSIICSTFSYNHHYSCSLWCCHTTSDTDIDTDANMFMLHQNKVTKTRYYYSPIVPIPIHIIFIFNRLHSAN